MDDIPGNERYLFREYVRENLEDIPFGDLERVPYFIYDDLGFVLLNILVNFEYNLIIIQFGKMILRNLITLD